MFRNNFFHVTNLDLNVKLKKLYLFRLSLNNKYIFAIN